MVLAQVAPLGQLERLAILQGGGPKSTRKTTNGVSEKTGLLLLLERPRLFS